MDRRQRALAFREEARSRVASVAKELLLKVRTPDVEETRRLSNLGEAFTASVGHFRSRNMPR